MANKTIKQENKVAKRQYMSQSDVPNESLEMALRIPLAIAENYASRPTTPLNVASAMNLSPTSSYFRKLCGASIAYGLTDGGCNSKLISIETLGLRITGPLKENDDIAAKREAILKPRVIREFLNKYAGSPLPRHDIAMNVLVDIGVPRPKAKSVLDLIMESAKSVGFTKEIKGKVYVDLSGVATNIAQSEIDVEELNNSVSEQGVLQDGDVLDANSITTINMPSIAQNRRVFITHGKNQAFIEPIKRILEFGELTPFVSVEKQTVSKPVPEKVMDDMRSCGAAIIHVEAEETLIDKNAKEQTIINPNVLIEIGAAMALYGKRFILLVRDGVKLPSNLQGLYEVRYNGETLDGDTTLRLLEAIKDIKNNPFPTYQTIHI